MDSKRSVRSCFLPLTGPPADDPIADVDLKKAAKFFAQKFATGASVTKNPQGLDEIVVQGDVSGDIVEMIEEGVGLLKNVPKDNIVEVEEKTKKS